MHQGPLARWILLGSMAITYGIRLPATVAMSVMTVRDLILGLAPAMAPWLMPEPRDVTKPSVLHEIQPMILVPSIGGMVMIAVLDTIWMNQWARPRLAEIAAFTSAGRGRKLKAS
jgi:hypothetical protein